MKALVVACSTGLASESLHRQSADKVELHLAEGGQGRCQLLWHACMPANLKLGLLAGPSIEVQDFPGRLPMPCATVVVEAALMRYHAKP